MLFFKYARIGIILFSVISFRNTTDVFAAGRQKDRIISWWNFDNDSPGYIFEKVSQDLDSLYGHYEYVRGIEGKGIKLDGFRTYAKINKMNQADITASFTIESWIAPAMYPWAWSPVFDCSDHNIRGFFFGLDQLGHIGLKMAAGNEWYQAVSDLTIPLRKWSHIAAVYKANDRLTVYINGIKAATVGIKGTYVPSRNGSATIGRNNKSQVWEEFQLTTPDTYFFLDAILDEIRILDRAKTQEELQDYCTRVGTLPEPALSTRDKFPTGPVGTGSFGAFYAKLDYYREWDDLWRVSDKPDIFVRFDNSPVQLIFWRGTSFVPCWVSEKNIWYANEWLETWGNDVVSCAEPIMDRQCRYSHIRLIENTDARVVIHWRYALSDAFYKIAAVSDDGRGEWCDEFYIIYPDNIGIRRAELHYSEPERRHDWVEQMLILPPGKHPKDVIENREISILNMRGDSKRYSWDRDVDTESWRKGLPALPKGANISYVHLKSDYRPFIIVSPNPVHTVEGNWDSPFFGAYKAETGRGYRPAPVPSIYGWWNHWPVAQIPGDGRWVVTPDRPSAFSLTTYVQWEDYEKTDRTRTRIMLHGMTNRAPADLLPVARAWLNAPEMMVSCNGFSGGRYDQAERAYLLEKTDTNNNPLVLDINASGTAPILNPAFIIKNWGKTFALVQINGKRIPKGDSLKQGIRSTPYGDDLIVWLRLDCQESTELSFIPEVD